VTANPGSSFISFEQFSSLGNALQEVHEKGDQLFIGLKEGIDHQMTVNEPLQHIEEQKEVGKNRLFRKGTVETGILELRDDPTHISYDRVLIASTNVGVGQYRLVDGPVDLEALPVDEEISPD
jgi:hypothetical protein